MPYKKKTYRKKRPQKKSAYSTAQQALALAKKANKKELQLQNSSIVNTTMVGSGIVTGGLNPDFTNVTRIGDAIKIHSVSMRATVTMNPTPSTTSYRLIIVQYLQDGTPPFLHYCQSDAINSQRALDHRFDFQTLYDKTFHLDTSDPIKQHYITVRPKKHTNYESNAVPVESNGLYLMYISNQGGATAPVINYSFARKWTDN